MFCMSAKFQHSRRAVMTSPSALQPLSGLLWHFSLQDWVTIYLVCSFQLLHMGLCKKHQCSSSAHACPNILGYKALLSHFFLHRPQSSQLSKPLTESTGGR